MRIPADAPSNSGPKCNLWRSRARTSGIWDPASPTLAEIQLTVGTIEVDEKRYSIGIKDLEPVDDPTEARDC